jgi:perosamine synthetase
MQFKIGFDERDRSKLHEYLDDILTNNKWSEGKYLKMFEDKWSEHVGAHSVAFSSWYSASQAVMKFYQLKGRTVFCPSNTFMATPLAVISAGGTVEFIDCNKNDLCISLEDIKNRFGDHMPRAIIVVHIGGHIAFEIEKLVEFCKEYKVTLIEDCAHAHGGIYKGKHAGTFGDCGIYSFYATKTISTGEGGMLVSNNISLIEFARQYRDYGKPDYKYQGVNGRMSEFNAAIGAVQTDRLNEIVAWKNEHAEKYLDPVYRSTKLNLPEGMISGLYKYIVFQDIPKSTGRVYDQPCHRILKRLEDLPNTDWVAKSHSCVPLYYKGE